MKPMRALFMTLRKFPALPRNGGGERPIFHFHIRRSARERYHFEPGLFSTSGNVILPDFRAARVFAQKINEVREAAKYPERGVKAGHINAMGLIDEIYHFILRLYEESANPGVFARARGHLEKESGKKETQTVLQKFGELFPPRDVHAGSKEVKDFLDEQTGPKPNSEILLEEVILLYFANINPAFSPFKELFDDAELSGGSAYRNCIAALEAYFRTEPPFGPENQFIFDLLRAPILASPHSLDGQLEFIKRQWGLILSEKFLAKLLGAGDLLREESRLGGAGAPGAAPALVPHYPPWDSADSDRFDRERFTADFDWMPQIVMLAKNTYVWLEQLSKKYRRRISRLDEIPDEELDQLARWNITGLWLIGIWERSRASQRIKQMTGNPEAVASAYSIYDYVIAGDLGGEEAFLSLRHRAWQRGIRMAGDMVPNHVGLYSKWVVDHPDFFVQSEYSPFPNYRFTGENLSDDPRIELRIEDGYWTRRDAAVVFQRIDTRTGETRYIYHGNDGTNMPWNDTAQLNFLKAEVRETVIRTILHVAGKFSIIRFDAAMTLTRQHFRRLWFPQPGSGGDIPSRADHAMSREEFDRLFPEEFWREVVDRINAEMPQTLLLAEAFWLLEGYFVRTLGMHRVYNSAFMHMLMREENSKYRELIRNTLAYNPEILKRYVNFMSNPDEETAIGQFGRDDKYFGVALMMVTLPGLPMLAHGQIEGFREKYGMEYKRAYYDEQPDADLVRRHEREIFPLMGKRRLFSHVENFELYDLVDAKGGVNENVFAYSNRDGEDRALVCFHNTYAECAGWIRTAVPKVSPSGAGGERGLGISNLADALALESGEGVYYIFRDQKSGLEFIRSGIDLRERGMYLHLNAFQYQVFTEFRKVEDSSGAYARLADSLEGRGVPGMEDALLGLRLRPVHEAFGRLISAGSRGSFTTAVDDYARFLRAAAGFLGVEGREEEAARGVKPGKKEEIAKLSALLLSHGDRKPKRGEESHDPFRLVKAPSGLALLLSWLFTRTAGRLAGGSDIPARSAELIDRLRLAATVHSVIDGERLPGGVIMAVELIALLILHDDVFAAATQRETLQRTRHMLDDGLVRSALRANIHDGQLYYHKEAFDELVDWLFIAGLMRRPLPRTAVEADTSLLQKIHSMSDTSGYRLEELKKLLMRPEPRHREAPTSR
jgi:glycosidase